MKHRSTITLALALSLTLAACKPAEVSKTDGADGDAQTSANASSSDIPNRVYWGDTHLHTQNSGDAFAAGTRLGADDALRFAQGEKVTSTTGVEAQLDRPLDFLVIADHAEGLGISAEIANGNETLMTDKRLRRWRDLMNGTEAENGKAARELITQFAQGTLPEILSAPSVIFPLSKSIWQNHTATVERHNRPGKFTAFHGFEYTSMPSGNNLHRVVMFRDGKKQVDQLNPVVLSQNKDPEFLWGILANYQRRTYGQALAIPHNSNLSNGLMFALTDFEGGPLTKDYAERRARWEPLVEATQIKGDSESHPFLSPNDEFASYGDDGWDVSNLDGSTAKTDEMLHGDYVREALKNGLLLEQQLGVNPFKFGLIGATDSHTGLATADENNYFGKFKILEPSAKRAMYSDPISRSVKRFGWQYLSGGYAGVWATDNSRGAIFDAMMRKEVYATTGPRMIVRIFAGWDFSDADLSGGDFAKAGYAKGVPMGGDLKAAADGETPGFLISALRDPVGANLDRVQIVKGWVDADGKTQERVFDVLWSDMETRKQGEDGKLPDVGNTVDIAAASWENSIGAEQLTGFWKDPEFDAAQRAFYYARVIEIPTPRWPAYDALRFKLKLPEDVNMITRERAYTSPIWYTPKG